MVKVPNEDTCIPKQGPIRQYIDWACEQTHAPPLFHLASILACVSYEACRRGYRVPVYGPPRLWFILAAPSGSAKSTAFRLARNFFKRCYRRGRVDEDPFISLDGSLPGVIYKLSGREDPVTERTIGVVWDAEVSQVLSRERSDTYLCKLYDGDEIERNAVYLQRDSKESGEDKTLLRNPAIQLVGLTTAASLEAVATTAMIQGGFFSRVLWIPGQAGNTDSHVDTLFDGSEGDHTPPDALVDAWVRWFGVLDGYNLRQINPTVYLDPAAKPIVEQLRDKHITPLQVYGEERQNAAASRALEHIVNLAGVFAIARGQLDEYERVVAGLEDFEPAINLVRYAMQHALGLTGTLAVDNVVRMQHKIADFVKTKGEHGASRADIYRKFNLGKKTLDPALDALLDQDAVIKKTLHNKRPGRPSVRYIAAEYEEYWRAVN